MTNKSIVIVSLIVLLCMLESYVAVKDFETLRHLKSKVSPDIQTKTVQQLFDRVLGSRSKEFKVLVSPSLGAEDRDTFLIRNVGNTVNITGTTGVAAAMGLYYYLTNYCQCQITWGGRQMNIPKDLPKLPASGITMVTNDRFRYFSNVCTPSYSFVWYEWSDWEKMLDWWALRGINMPLAFTGQEAIFQRVYSKMNFTTYELQRHFGGPGFLAWSRMGNMHGWGGPITQSWLDGQLTLQHQILDRARALGMIPVLPGFAGHVPEAITWLYPYANVSRLPDWASFNYTYCCNLLLDFDDPLFKKIGMAFTQELTKEFGTDHIYNIDTFNEMTPKSNDPAYLSKSSRTIYEMITEADPDGIWLMQGWLFQDVSFWGNSQIQALLSGVPLGKMIILDLFSEVAPIFTRTNSYYGHPFIWCMLHNFGGTSEMYGALVNINNGPFDGRAFPNSSMVGIGMTPEGIYQNEMIYEFFAENFWRTKPRDIAQWISNYTTRRYGKYDRYVDLGWQYLKQSVYNNKDSLRDHSKNAVPVTRPRVTPHLSPDKSLYNNTDHLHDNSLYIIPTTRPRVTPMIHPDVWYDPEDLFIAWDILTLASDGYVNNSLYLYDLVDVTRNSLQIISLQLYQDLINSFLNKNVDEVKEIGSNLLGLLKDMDTVLGSDPHFLLGKWISAARNAGTNAAEKDKYEFNARNQVTLWGPKGEILDYACKQWSGLIAGYYRPRWQLFVDTLVDSLQKGEVFIQSAFDRTVLATVEQPFSYDKTKYPSEPIGDTISIVKDIHSRYRPNTMTKSFRKFFQQRLSHQKDNRDWIEKKYSRPIVRKLSKISRKSSLRNH